MPDEFLTVAEVAAILKLNRQTVRNWIDSGLLPALHIGRRVRIKRSDFDGLLDQSHTGGTSVAGASTARGDDYAPREAPRVADGRQIPPEPLTTTGAIQRSARTVSTAACGISGELLGQLMPEEIQATPGICEGYGLL